MSKNLNTGADRGAKNQNSQHDERITSAWLKELLAEEREKITKDIAIAAKGFSDNLHERSNSNHENTRKNSDANHEETRRRVEDSVAKYGDIMEKGFEGTNKNVAKVYLKIDENNQILKRMEERDQPRFGTSQFLGIVVGVILAIAAMLVLPVGILGVPFTIIIMIFLFGGGYILCAYVFAEMVESVLASLKHRDEDEPDDDSSGKDKATEQKDSETQGSRENSKKPEEDEKSKNSEKPEEGEKSKNSEKPEEGEKDSEEDKNNDAKQKDS